MLYSYHMIQFGRVCEIVRYPHRYPTTSLCL